LTRRRRPRTVMSPYDPMPDPAAGISSSTVAHRPGARVAQRGWMSRRASALAPSVPDTQDPRRLCIQILSRRRGLNCNVVCGSMLWKYAVLTVSVSLIISCSYFICVSLASAGKLAAGSRRAVQQWAYNLSLFLDYDQSLRSLHFYICSTRSSCGGCVA
jgi:hypothetical protein